MATYAAIPLPLFTDLGAVSSPEAAPPAQLAIPAPVAHESAPELRDPFAIHPDNGRPVNHRNPVRREDGREDYSSAAAVRNVCRMTPPAERPRYIAYLEREGYPGQAAIWRALPDADYEPVREAVEPAPHFSPETREMREESSTARAPATPTLQDLRAAHNRLVDELQAARNALTPDPAAIERLQAAHDASLAHFWRQHAVFRSQSK